DAGLDEAGAARGYRSLLGLAIASVLVSSPEPSPARGRGEPVAETFRRTAETADLHHLRRVLPALVGDGCDTDFDFELDLLIAGFRAVGADRAGSSAADRESTPG